MRRDDHEAHHSRPAKRRKEESKREGNAERHNHGGTNAEQCGIRGGTFPQHTAKAKWDMGEPRSCYTDLKLQRTRSAATA